MKRRRRSGTELRRAGRQHRLAWLTAQAWRCRTMDIVKLHGGEPATLPRRRRRRDQRARDRSVQNHPL
ncbi:hypothetical protein LNQ03_04695 [Klebsiella pneumoniae subsp. pneumoniae]|nr:hypothetical protein [Klebsiella pneumoniae subsp. pneumoniae]